MPGMLTGMKGAILIQPVEMGLGLIVVLFGLAFGSFLNVCIARLPRHRSVVWPGSSCPQCGAAIRAADNIPLLSWVVLRGRCRSCRGAIAWRYPAVEAATAALFVLCWLRFGLTTAGVGTMVLCFLLLGLAAMDAETMRLPDAFTLPGIGLGILYAAVQPAASGSARLSHSGAAALWAAGGALVVLAIRLGYYLARRTEGMGLGDAKLLALIAAWLGPGLTVLTLFLGVVAAAVAGLVLVAAGRREGLAARLPFGSFLCAAALYAVFAGQPVVAWYLGFFR